MTTMRDWIKENIGALLAIALMIGIVAAAIVAINAEDAAIERKCAAALRGATVSDSPARHHGEHSVPPMIYALILAFFGWLNAWYFRAKMLREQKRSQHWFSGSMGEKPLLNEGQACQLMADLFRPGVLDDAATMVVGPSITRDVERQRLWRERRAITSLDHTTRHEVEDIPNEPLNDSFAVHMKLRQCAGKREVDE